MFNRKICSLFLLKKKKKTLINRAAMSTVCCFEQQNMSSNFSFRKIPKKCVSTNLKN